MQTDVFHWTMDASMHIRQVALLRTEVATARSNQTPLAIRDVLVLVPLNTMQSEEAIQRGDLTFSGDQFENRDDQPLYMEFGDPVLETFSAEIPARWAGTVELDGDTVKVRFDPPIELEIPRLAEMGVNRSSFQALTRVTLSPSVSTSVLQEVGRPEKETWVEAILTENALFEMAADADVASYVKMFGSTNPCGSTEDEPNWYLVRRKRDRLCFVHDGKVITGGQVAYDVLYGPATKADCEEQEKILCP